MNALQIHEIDDIPQERERFTVESIEQVNWALRKLSAIAAKREEVKQLAAAEIARIQEWHDAETRKLDDNKSFFESLLAEYALRQRDTDPKWTKATTPYGAVKFKKQQPKWQYDDAKLLESLKALEMNVFIRIKEEPNKVELKKIAKVVNGMVVDPDSGAVLEGVTVEEQPDTVVIDL